MLVKYSINFFIKEDHYLIKIIIYFNSIHYFIIKFSHFIIIIHFTRLIQYIKLVNLI